MVGDEPFHQQDGRRLDRHFQRPGGVHGHQGRRLFDAHPGDALVLEHFQTQPHRGTRLGGRPGKLGVALAGVHVAKIEERSRMKDGQENAIAGRDVADVEIAAPLTLAIQTRAHFAVRSDAERADERRDRPGNLVAKVKRAIARAAAGAGRVAEHLGRVILG